MSTASAPRPRARGMARREVAVEDLKANLEARVERRTAHLPAKPGPARHPLNAGQPRGASACAEGLSRPSSATVSHEARGRR